MKPVFHLFIHAQMLENEIRRCDLKEFLNRNQNDHSVTGNMVLTADKKVLHGKLTSKLFFPQSTQTVFRQTNFCSEVQAENVSLRL